ncbi:MAG TPA: DUF4097 family beta strand repeat-containing protein [Candidatus Dormibacteraeota bacterium]|nr:DUF4097 family beta strand repeat-containing protein [Candidatus Dormibacteraeota bacterium]
MRRFLAILALTVLALPGCISGDFGGDAVHSTMHERFALAPHAHVRVSNVSGPIVIVPWNRHEIDIVARKHAGNVTALRRTTINVTRDTIPATDVEISTHYQHDGFFFWGESGAGVDYTIHVPRDISLQLANVSGDVSVSGMQGAVEINEVSGEVTASGVGGDLSVNAVSGDVNASMLHMTGNDRAEIQTVSGSVTLAVPPSSNASVSAQSISGGFHSDFPIPSHRQTVGVSADGRIGNGSATISLKTISGDMHLTRR